jgi:3-oxoacyl-[acyl-carrier protein] reductase
MSMRDLTGKVALVTGGSRGIGQAVARQLAAQGALVIAGARAEATETVAAITAAGGQAESVAFDVTDAASIQAAVAGVLERHGRLDILVNNAGITRDQLMLRMKREEWDQVIATNLTSAFVCVQAVVKPMVKQRVGRIISISSVVGQMGNAGQANYAASKAGLIGFSKALARELASRNITVNVVAPGMIETDMTRALTEKTQVDWAAQIPAGRLGTPADVAAAVSFLASDEASYITGQVLAVNGGMYM